MGCEGENLIVTAAVASDLRPSISSFGELQEDPSGMHHSVSGMPSFLGLDLVCFGPCKRLLPTTAMWDYFSGLA